MFTLILLISICQLPDTPEDAYFMQRQEDFAIESLQEPKRLFRHIPQRMADILNECTENCYKCRERARKDLREYTRENPREVRWLFWALHAKNPHIKSVARNVLRNSLYCRECVEEKSGKLEVKSEKKEDETERGYYWRRYYDHCRTCENVRYLWTD